MQNNFRSARSGFGSNNRNANRSFSGNRSRGGSFGGGQRYIRKKTGGEKIPLEKLINKATKNIDSAEKYVPVNQFKDFAVHEKIKINLNRKGFENLTPIQDQSIPHILQGKDLIGIASTGTGKTLAFLLPMLNKAMKSPDQKILIVTPTRELALQIETELYKITYQIDVRRVVCIGGANIGRQISELRRHHNFVIGTPGRLKDLAERRILRLDSFNNVVVDEVDRMFDMGFAPDVKHLLNGVSQQRQSLFFSATVDHKVISLINEFSNSPVTVRIESRDTAESVDQDVVKIQRGENKIEVLHNLLQQEDFKKILIFGRTKHGVHRLAENLRIKGHKAESIHGDKSQQQRQRSLKMFKDGVVNILVATDVAARGIDVPGVTHVINFELPSTYADYIHRIGRTGRANMTGKALTLIEE